MPYVIERTFKRIEVGLHQVWAAHEKFLRALAARGVLLGGGSWEGGEGEFLLIDVPDEVSLHRALRADPLVRAALVATSRTRNWSVEYGGAVLTGRETEGRTAARKDALTAQEVRIARMVLAGMTNQEIADCLRISRRGVEQHLTRTYRKLSIRRRAQLATALNALPSAEDSAGRPSLTRVTA